MPEGIGASDGGTEPAAEAAHAAHAAAAAPAAAAGAVQAKAAQALKDMDSAISGIGEWQRARHDAMGDLRMQLVRESAAGRAAGRAAADDELEDPAVLAAEHELEALQKLRKQMEQGLATGATRMAADGSDGVRIHCCCCACCTYTTF